MITETLTDTDYKDDTLYLKLEPVDWDTWSNGIITVTGDGNGSFSWTRDETKDYTFFRQVGGSPADTDPSVGPLSALVDVPSATENATATRTEMERADGLLKETHTAATRKKVRI